MKADDALPEAVTINVRKEVLRELVLCEEGAYEAAQRSYTGRPLHAHVHKIAQRYTGRLVIRTYAEAEDAYYAVCSGTFSIRNRACFNAAVRIATALQPYARQQTVATWPVREIEAP